MHTTPYRRRATFIEQWLVGLAMTALAIPTAPSVVFGQPSPDPTGKVPGTVDLPVDISIDIVRGDEDTLPKPEITIHLLNAKSGKEVDLALPRTNVPSDHPSGQVTAPPFDAPPVEAPPVTAPPFDTPPFDAPPVVTPPLDVPVADLPPVDVPAVEAPPVATPPVDMPAGGRP